jgi:hypothetical protein
MSTLEFRLEQTMAEVKELTSVVRQLVATTPQRNKQWLQPSEFAQLLGIAPRTLAQWRTDGRFRPISVRKQGRGYQFHADWALADAQEVSRGRRRSCRRRAAATPCQLRHTKAQLGGKRCGPTTTAR